MRLKMKRNRLFLMRKLSMGVVWIACLGLAASVMAAECDESHFEPIIVECKTPGWVALTFDDGPHSNTPEILDTLYNYNVKATFFVVGQRLEIERYAGYLQDIAAQGHVIGNHTWSHQDLTLIWRAQIKDEISKTADIVAELTGIDMKYTRPPHGHLSVNSAIPLWDKNQTIALWNLDSFDYKPISEVSASQQLEIIENTFASRSPATSSFVLLLHDFSEQTKQNLGAIIELARSYGYKLGTMDDCVEIEN